MDTNQLIVGLIQALAWPLVTLAIVLLLRKPIIVLLQNIEKMRWQGVELEFGKRLVNAEKDAKELKLPSAEKAKLPSFKQDMSLYERMKAIAEISPEAAVINSWKEVEIAAMQVAKSRRYPTYGSRTVQKVIEDLIDDGLLDKGALGLYDNLRVLRNSAAHRSDYSITVSEAIRYIELSLSLANRLQEIANSESTVKAKKR